MCWWNEETCTIIAYQLCSIDNIYRQNETDIYIITYFCIYSFRYFISTLYHFHMVNTKTPRNHLWKEVLLKHQAPLKRVLVLINQIGNETPLSSCFFHSEIELWYGWSVGRYDSWNSSAIWCFCQLGWSSLWRAQGCIEKGLPTACPLKISKGKDHLPPTIFQALFVGFREGNKSSFTIFSHIWDLGQLTTYCPSILVTRWPVPNSTRLTLK